MDKLAQLVEQSKKTVLNLQQQSEQWSALLSADQVLCELASSSISSLLRPFSMNHINSLNQAVSVAPFVQESSPQGCSILIQNLPALSEVFWAFQVCPKAYLQDCKVHDTLEKN